MTKISLVLALLLMYPASALAHTTIIEPLGSHLPYQRWIDESEVPTPDVTLSVIETEPGNGCPVDERTTNIEACTIIPERMIWIAVPDQPNAHPREAFMHEVAHYFGTEDMPEWARERFNAIYGLGGPWLLPESGLMTAGEWFAEAYAQCSVKAYVTRREMTALGLGPIDGSAPLFGMRIAHNKVCRMMQGL